MKKRIAVLLAAVAAIMLLTAGTNHQARPIGQLTDRQMTTLVGGEQEMGCLDKLVLEVIACNGKSTAEEISSCKASAEISYMFCRIWSIVSWIFAWLL